MSIPKPCQTRPGNQEPTFEGGEDDIQENGFVQLRSRIGTSSFIESAVPNIQQLGAYLNAAVQAIWPTRHQSRYSRVHVLIISWIYDDLGVWREIIPLRTVLEERYNFKVEEYKIPGISQPDRALKRRVIEFLDSSDGEDILLIVYYAGHARRAPEENASPLWCANRSSPNPAISSGGIQSMFEEADADVLLLYDCCHSASVPIIGFNVPATGIKRKSHAVEVIAACGYETIAAAVDQHSFSKALTQVLALKSGGKPFSVGWLHGQILGRLKCWVPSVQLDRNGKFIEDKGRWVLEHQPRRTPIYSIVCETEPRRSIQIASLPRRDEPSSLISTSRQNACPVLDSTSTLQSDSLATRDLMPRNPDPTMNHTPCPQLRLTIPLNNSEFNITQWTEWVRNLPVAGTNVRIEGIHETFSNTLVVHKREQVRNRLPSNETGVMGSVGSQGLSARPEQEIAISSSPSSLQDVSSSCHKRENIECPSQVTQTTSKGIGKTIEREGVQIAAAVNSDEDSRQKALGDDSRINSAMPSTALKLASGYFRQSNAVSPLTSAPLSAAHIFPLAGPNDSRQQNAAQAPRIMQTGSTSCLSSLPPIAQAHMSWQADSAHVLPHPESQDQLYGSQPQAANLSKVSTSAFAAGSKGAWKSHHKATQANADYNTTQLSFQEFRESNMVANGLMTNTQSNRVRKASQDLQKLRYTSQKCMESGSSKHRRQPHNSHGNSSSRKQKKERTWHYEQMWYCCQCHPGGVGPLSIWNDHCASCGHVRDGSCFVENNKIYDSR